MSSLRDSVERDGYAVLRGALRQQELECLRTELRSHFAQRWNWEGLGKHQPGAAVEIPTIGWIFSHPPVVDAFRELTGSKSPVFTGNCDAHMNMLSWWHKDTGSHARSCFQGDFYNNPSLRVYRAGIYLQDHSADGCGLHVRRGSHHTRSLDEGEVETLKTNAGDIVFFDIRLTHAGQFADPLEFALLKAAGKLGTPAAGYYLKETWRMLARRQDKLSIFFTFGAPGVDTLNYCDFEAAAQRRRNRESRPILPPEVVDALARNNVDCNPEMV